MKLLKHKSTWALPAIVILSLAPSELCRLLGISTQLHQTFFDAVASADHEETFSSRPLSEAMERSSNRPATQICTSLRTM
jgi:hypothetical protein